ncbi:MAG: DUF3108 domain-containing protein [Thiobacillus sp.]
MGRSLRPWWLALALSLLLHLTLFGGLSWTLPQWDASSEPSPFEAQLVPADVPTVGVSPPPRPPPTAQRPALRQPERLRVVPPADQPVEPVAKPVVESPEPEVIAQASPIDTAVRVEEAPSTEPGPVEAVPPPLNPLPPRLDLRFDVHYGLASGEQTLLWVNEGKRYTVISVAEATGLAGIFYRGRFVQTSRGRITSRGLQPEEFWDQRGNKRSSARFDATLGHLALTTAKGVSRHFVYQGDVQDVVSLFFQLALTAPPPDGQLTYKVFNGKKLHDYTYEVRGKATLETELGALRTVHLARVAEDEGRFEVWLAIDRHYLPVRVLRSDDKGNEVELRLKSIAP